MGIKLIFGAITNIQQSKYMELWIYENEYEIKIVNMYYFYETNFKESLKK